MMVSTIEVETFDNILNRNDHGSIPRNGNFIKLRDIILVEGQRPATKSTSQILEITNHRWQRFLLLHNF